MSITLTSASLPVFRTALSNLAHLLDKAERNAQARGFDPNVFMTMRLAPDMLPFPSQVRIACDAAKLAIARVGQLEAPKFEDNEVTLADLKARVARTLDWLSTVGDTALDGREAQEVVIPIGGGRTRTMTGESYLKHWAIPNMYFHITTAYALLRHAGVDLGKADYLAGAAANAG